MAAKKVFPIFVYDPRVSVVKSISRDKHQGLTTGLFLSLWVCSFVLLLPTNASLYFLLFSSVFQNFTYIYEFFLVYKTLTLSDRLFEGVSVGDMVKCMQSAVDTLENAEANLRGANNSPQALLKALRLFFNVNLWRKVKLQQRKELNLPLGASFSKEDIDLSGEDDQELLDAAGRLELISGGRVERAEKLKNYARVCEVVGRKSLNLKALAAAFTIQVSVHNLVNVKKNAMELRKEEAKADESITFIKKQELTQEGYPVPNLNLRKFEMGERPEEIPENVQYDPTSFFDHNFAKGEFNDCCTWIRAKDIPPNDKQLALFSDATYCSDSCESDIQFSFSLQYRQGGLNDCWVIAAMTIVAAETPEVINDIFITKEVQESGKYHLKLFSYGQMKIVELDDYFPCYNYTVRLRSP